MVQVKQVFNYFPLTYQKSPAVRDKQSKTVIIKFLLILLLARRTLDYQRIV